MLIENIFYESIKKSMPIPCIDLIVVNSKDEVLMLKRSNDPAKGQWWFPGGRIHFGETREDAVHRKLKQECGIVANSIKQLGTEDVMLRNLDDSVSHAITTVFMVYSDGKVILDSQSEEAMYKAPQEWLELDIHSFIKKYVAICLGVDDAR